ncbi:MAG: DUF4012 domain-containing protein [Patescibacteria group bacterium]
MENPDALSGPELNDCEPMVSYEPVKLSSKTKKRKYLLYFFVILVVITVCIVLFNIGRFVTSGLDAKVSLESAQEYAMAFDFDNAIEQVHIAQKDLHTAKGSLWVVKPLIFLPWVGDQVDALVVMVDTGVVLVDVLDNALLIVGDVYSSVSDIQSTLNEIPGIDKTYTFKTLPAEVRVEMLQTLQSIAPDLAQARIQIREAQDKLSQLDDEHMIYSMQVVVDRLEEILPSVSSAIELITPFAQSIDELAGVGKDRQWLLLFLNNTEMRPGGGFMGVYGLLQMRDGEIVDITTDNTYSIDWLTESDNYQVEPPYPISAYLGLDTWYFRDANWSPDFAESAKTATQLLRQEYAFAGLPVPQIDGVIGFTPTTIEQLLNIVGDITVDGITFTSENFTETLEYQVEYGFKEHGVEWDDRKEIINDLMDVLMERLMDISIDQLPNLLAVLTQMFDTKQVALYSFDTQTQNVFVDANWSSVIDASEVDDVLMVVDANMGALKTDHAMEKEITYSIKPVGDHYEAQADIVYKHTGGFDWRTTRYQTYTSIMVPLGSELLYTNGQDASAYEEIGLTRFGSYIVIEPGETKTLTFQYRLPGSIKDAIDDKAYELMIFKQIGSKQASLTLDLDFGKKLRAAVPAEDQDQFGDNKYHLNTNLSQDTELLVQF